MYPDFKIEINKNPNRFYAVPFIGIFVKSIILIPQVIELLFLMIAMWVVVLLINPFVVLFTGKYWQTAYDLSLGYLRFYTKSIVFMFGLSDKYPGFDLEIHDNYSVDMPMPTAPNRLYAIPLLGSLIRMILLIPYYIFFYVIYYAAYIGIMVWGWFSVLFMGRYPEALFELSRDAIRVLMSLGTYSLGLSDKYPSFNISWNHKTTKVILIVVSILLIVFNYASGAMKPASTEKSQNPYQNLYQNQNPADINIQNNINNYYK